MKAEELNVISAMDGREDDNVATMSDQQFRASLDALLGDMETLVGGTQETGLVDVSTSPSITAEAIITKPSTISTTTALTGASQTATLAMKSVGNPPNPMLGVGGPSQVIQPKQQEHHHQQPPSFPQPKLAVATLQPQAHTQALVTAPEASTDASNVSASVATHLTLPLIVYSSAAVGGTSLIQQHPPSIGTAGSAALANLHPAPATSSRSSTPASSITAAADCKPHAKRRRVTASATASSSMMNSVSAVSEDEGELQRRRQDRNMREQMRSHQITHQIAQLGSVLKAADLEFKPDKYSTLVKVVDFIKALQARNEVLDSEHRKLIDAITKTTEIVNNQYVPAHSSEPVGNNLLVGAESQELKPEDESMVFVQGLDYKAIFECCHVACGIARIDGRFIDCNKEFEDISGYAREELLPLESVDTMSDCMSVSCTKTTDSSISMDDGMVSMTPSSIAPVHNMSLFNILERGHMEPVFRSMSDMLKTPAFVGVDQRKADSWSHLVRLCRRPDSEVRLSVNIVRTSQGRPRFFNCLVLGT